MLQLESNNSYCSHKMLQSNACIHIFKRRFNGNSFYNKLKCLTSLVKGIQKPILNYVMTNTLQHYAVNCKSQGEVMLNLISLYRTLYLLVLHFSKMTESPDGSQKAQVHMTSAFRETAGKSN